MTTGYKPSDELRNETSNELRNETSNELRNELHGLDELEMGYNGYNGTRWAGQLP
jgi:hypothetical protein